MKVYDPALLGLQIARVMGDEIQVFCPYHSDKRPSAEYNVRKGVFYCFGCQQTRNARQLADDLGGELSEIDLEASKYHELIGKTSEWLSIIHNELATDNKYLTDRMVDGWQVRSHKILEDDHGVFFPIKDTFDRLIGFQSRRYNLSPKYMFYGERMPIWPIKHAIRRDRIFITEGVFGALRGELFGANTAAMMGASNVLNVINFFRTNTRVEPYVIMDNDYAGRLAAGKFVLCGIKAAIVDVDDYTAPDEWNDYLWDHVTANTDDFFTLDVNEIIEKSSRQDELFFQLEKFWRKL